MYLYTIESVPGKEIAPLGLVKGATVQTKHFGKDFLAGFKSGRCGDRQV